MGIDESEQPSKREGEISAAVEREIGKQYEYVAIKQVEIMLGNNVIPVGKETLFFVGQYLEVGDTSSKIEPIGQGTSVRYSGAVDTGRVLARNLQGNVAADIEAADQVPTTETLTEGNSNQ